MCMVTFDWGENDAKKKFVNFDEIKKLCWVVVEITDYCNFRCKWCFANSWLNKNPEHMRFGDLKKLIHFLSDSGVKQITLSGGEPTLYPHLRDAIKEARKHDMIVHMNTNGFLLTEKLARELHSLGLSQVQITVDSLNPKKHETVRGVKGSWARAIKALINAKKTGMTAACQTVLTKENEGEVLDIFRFARKLGIQRCRVWDMTPSEGCSIENQKLMPSDYMSTLKRLCRYAELSGARNVESGDPLFNAHIKTKLNVTGGFCVAAAGLYTTISHRGDVYFCATIRKPLYNIFKVIPSTVDFNLFHRKKVVEYIRTLKIPSYCMKCPFIHKCMSGCYTRREFMWDDVDYCCKFIPAASKESIYKKTLPSTA